jgi:hypothetical protein
MDRCNERRPPSDNMTATISEPPPLPPLPSTTITEEVKDINLDDTSPKPTSQKTRNNKFLDSSQIKISFDNDDGVESVIIP